jgi:3-phenylpropionate/trans-cinnamate dioxygenase ferredoxin subunit
MNWTNVCKDSALVPGTYQSIEVDGVMILVFNLNGEFYALEDVCPHDYSCLDGGEIDGEEIVCPHHGARFAIKTGEVTAPPAYEGVTTFPVQIENGMVQVRDHRWD